MLESQRSENEQEREMHQVLRKHYDDMKLKFEVLVDIIYYNIVHF
jgi:hypothetical protein